MNKLRTRFGLALSTVLLAATILPIVLLFVLSKSGLVEAVYVAEGNGIRLITAAPQWADSVGKWTTYRSPD
jgi:hypothetical protein